MIARIAPPRTANTNIEDFAPTVYANRNPALLIVVRLEFQKHVIPQQHVLGIGTADAMLGQVAFVVRIPIETGDPAPQITVYIFCTYIVNKARRRVSPALHLHQMTGMRLHDQPDFAAGFEGEGVAGGERQVDFQFNVPSLSPRARHGRGTRIVSHIT